MGTGGHMGSHLLGSLGSIDPNQNARQCNEPGRPRRAARTDLLRCRGGPPWHSCPVKRKRRGFRRIWSALLQPRLPDPGSASFPAS